MKKEEIEENVIENDEVVKNTENQLMVSNDFNSLQRKSKSDTKIFTNITDNKIIFNLENNCDYKINDCKGEIIRVKQVLIKIIETPLENPEIDSETGEIIKDKESKMITILIDDNGKSYVTGSKLFTLAFIKYINMFGFAKMEGEGETIKITERGLKNSSNMALSFELV